MFICLLLFIINFVFLKKATKINEKPASSGTIASSGFLRPFNSNDKKFQRNTDHTQSIKLIKENFANLFLSKKSNHSNEHPNKTNEIPDSDILRTIEIETNKNALTKQKPALASESINQTDRSYDNSKKFVEPSHDLQSR